MARDDQASNGATLLSGFLRPRSRIGGSAVPKAPRLTVYLSQAATFGKMDASGTLEQELALYSRLQDLGMRLQIFSHGGREEFAYAPRLGGMRILCNWLGLPYPVYARRGHLLHSPALLRSDFVMTHDTSALRSALRAEYAWQIPFVFRAGFHWSSNMRVGRPDDLDFIKLVDGMERRALQRAVQVIPSTRDIAEAFLEQAPDSARKARIIPNYVDTDIFRPLPSEKVYDLVFVGRIEPVKNLTALLQAVKRLGLTIAIIGGGTVLDSGKDRVRDEEDRLLERFGDLDGRIHWLGRLKNEELPQRIQQARAFILPSLQEGHPRAMIEAMACGMPVIGTKAPGIENLVQHKVTGYLCDTDSDSLARGIESLLAQPRLMQSLGDEARQFAVERFALATVAQQYRDMFGELAQRHPAPGAPARLSRYLVHRGDAS